MAEKQKLFIDFQVTQRCNHKCIYCQCKLAERWGELSFQEINNLFKWLQKLGPSICLILNGGEPFLREDIIEIIRLAKSTYHFARVAVLTNGTLLTQYVPQIIKTELDEIIISLDGWDDKSLNLHAFVDGSFKKIIESIETLKKYKKRKYPLIKITTVITQKNIDNLMDIIKLTHLKGADKWQPLPMQYCLQSSIHKNMALRLQDLEKLKNVIVQCYRKYPGFLFVSPNYWRLIQNYITQNFQVPDKCYGGFNSFYITSDGYVFPCYRYCSFSYQEVNDWINKIHFEHSKFHYFDLSTLAILTRKIGEWVTAKREIFCRGCCHSGNAQFSDKDFGDYKYLQEIINNTMQ